MPKSSIPRGDNKNLYLRGKTYWCRYSVRSQETRVSLHTTDVGKARKARDKLIQQAEDERSGNTPEALTLWENAIEEYLRFQEGLVRTGALSEKTAKRYNISLANLSVRLEGTPIAEINSASVLNYVTQRRESHLSASSIKNDLTAWSKVMAFAVAKTWASSNPVKDFDRAAFIGHDEDILNPPLDEEVEAIRQEVAAWREDMAVFMVWLRETGMRVTEGLSIWRQDIHPCGTKATLRRGVKRNKRSGLKTRTIDLGRAAALLPRLATKGRLFHTLSEDVDDVSSKYGQWKRQRAARALKAGLPAPREFRLHDLRHAFAIASLIDDPTCVYKLKLHLGHGSVTTTESYVRFLEGEGAQRQYARRPELFGSLYPAAAQANDRI